jgi:gliding motility-associated-like protein
MSGILQKHIKKLSLLLFFALITSISFAANPTTTSSTISVLEDQPRSITHTDFTFSDADGHAFAGIRVTSLPLKGTLRNNSIDVGIDQIVSIVDLQAGLFSYTPIANENGTAYTTFQFTVIDAADEESTPATMTIDVTPVNDPPTVNSVSNQSTNEDTPIVVNISGISAGAPNESDQFLTITAVSSNTAILSNGSLNYIQGETTAGITFTPAPDAVGTVTITLTIKDNGGTANPGDIDEKVITFNIEVIAVNDPPTLDDIISPAPIDEDAGQQTVSLSGITDGDPELTQALTITATSDNTNLVETFTIVRTGSTGTISYTPKPDAYGTAIVTVVVSDGELSVSKNFTIVVNPVNDPPTINPVGPVPAIDEDAPEQTIVLSGITPGPNEDYQTVTVVATSGNTSIIPHPTVLYNSGTNTWSISYAPLPDQFGSVLITITVTDNDTNQQSTSISFTQVVNPLNDPPTLNPIDNISINEDAGLQTVVFGGISDDGSIPQNLTVTASSSNTAIIPNPTVNYTSPNPSGSLNFQPTPNRFGIVTITVRVTDKESLFTEQSFQVSIANINDPPTLNDIPVPSAMLEDGPLQTITLTGISPGPFETEPLLATVTALDNSLFQVLTVSLSGSTGTLSYQPAPNANGSTIVTVRIDDQLGSNSIIEKSVPITILPVNDQPRFDIPAVHAISENSGPQNVAAFATNIDDGDPEVQTLTFSINTGIPSGNLEFISNPAINVNTGNLTFEAKANTNGSVVVEVTLIDNGGTANGGIDRITKSFTIIVTAVNEPPSFTLNGNPPDINEDAGIITEPAFARNIDDGDPELNQQLEFVITTVTGNLSFSSYPTINAITGDLTYQVADNSNGSAIFNVYLRETATLLISPTLQFTITVNAVNDPPEGNNGSVTFNEDQTYTFQATNFNFFDIDGHTFAGIQITALPVKGDLRYNGSAVAVGTICPNVTLLTYAPAPNTAGVPYTSFGFKVRDSSGDLSISSYTMTINVIDIPDNPVGASSSVNTLESQNYTFSVVDFPFNDPDGDAFNGIIIRTNVSKGSLQVNSVPLTVFPAPVNNVTQLVFLPVPGENGTPYTSFTFDVVDATGATSAGAPGSPYSMSINVGAVNDPPVGEDNTITLLEDQTYTFKIDDFKFFDPDGHAFDGIQITQVETAGTLKYEGTDVVVLGNYPDVTKLTYTPPSNQNGPALANFRFRVKDNSSELNISVASYTMTFNVTPVNDAPVFTITENPPTINEDAGPQTVTGFVSSIDDGDAEVTQVLTFLLTVPTHPTLTFSQAPAIDVATGNLTYTPAPNAYGVVTISVVLKDDGGTANGGVDQSASQEFTITVNPINDPPTLDDIAGTYVVNEDAATFNVNLTGISAGPNETQTITITTASSNEQIVPAPAVNYTSPNPTAVLSVTPAANAFGVVTITVTVSDGQSANSSVVKTFQVTVNPVNDPPTLDPIPSPAAILEDADTQTISLTGISAGPPNESQPLVVTATSNNESLIPTASIVVNYTSPNAIGSISYMPLADRSGTAEITVIVRDDGTINNTIERKFTVTVLPVNDPPTLDNLPASPIVINEDAGVQTLTLTGISAGGGETQPLTVTAASNNPGVIPNPTVGTITNGTAILSYAPLADKYGLVTITVTVDDGQAENNIISKSFQVDVRPVNDPPTLDPVAGSPFTINEDAPTQTVTLTGITAGGGETQTLVLSAISSNQTIIKDPTIAYTQGNTTATLSYTPEPDKSGTVTITVFVNDLSAANNLVSRTFTVIVNEVNDPPTINDIIPPADLPEDSPPQTVALTGITAGGGENQTVIVTAAEVGGAGIINTITINYSGNNNATLIFSLVPNANGTTTIEVTVDDQQPVNNITKKSFVVNVLKVNDPPTLDPIASPYNINEDAGEQRIELTGITPGPNESEQTVTVTAVSNNTALIPNPVVVNKTATTKDLVFTPVANANGTARITVTVNDGQPTNNLLVREFIVNVAAVNDPPFFDLSNTTVSVLENAGLQILPGFATNINDGDPELTQSVEFIVAFTGTVSFKTPPTISAANGELRFEANKDSNGQANVTVTLRDNGTPPMTSSPKEFTIIVLGVNSPPSFTLNGNPPATNEDAGPVVVENFARDIDDGDPEIDQSADLVFILQKLSGSVEFATSPAIDPATGNLSYETALNSFGTALISVVLSDGEAFSPTSFFTLTINPVNDPPVGADGSVETNEDVPYTFKVADFIYFDVESHAFNGIQIVSLPDKGILEYNNSVVSVNSIAANLTQLVFKPATDGNGTPYTTFGFRLRDSEGALSVAYTMTINVIPVDDNPTSAPGEVSTLENVTYTFKPADFTFNDVDGDTFNGVRIYSLPTRGTLQYLNSNATIGTIATNFNQLKFIPAPNESGDPYATFEFQVRDSKNALSQHYTMTIVVGPVNDRPTGANESITMLEDNNYTFKVSDFTFNDPDGHAFDGIRVETLETKGDLEYNGTDITTVPALCPDVTKLVFKPFPNENGLPYTTFTFKVKDNSASFNLSEANYTMTINVTPVNDAPSFTIASNPPVINEDTGLQTIVGFASAINDGDPEVEQVVTFNTPVLVSGSATLTFSTSPAISSIGTLTYQAAPNAYGTATFSVTLRDNGGTANGGQDTSAPQNFTITVTNVNDPPTINPIPNPAPIDEDADTQTITLQNITAGPLENQTLTVTATSSNPALIPTPTVNYTSPNTSGTLTYKPAPDQSGQSTITVRVSDGGTVNGFTEVSFLVIVNPVNDPPTINPVPDPAPIPENAGEQIINLSGITAGGGENQPLLLSVSSSNITLIPTPTLTYSGGTTAQLAYKPVAFESGESTITVTVDDQNGGVTKVSFKVVVTPVNDPPTLDPIADPAPITEDAPQQQITLTGISAGINEDQVLSFSVESSNATLLTISPVVYTQGASTGILRYTPNSNQFGNTIITVIIDDGGLQNNEVSRQFRVVVLPVADTPTVTDAYTNQSNQTTSGLVISRNEHDGNEVRFFKITNIQNGQLFLQDGITDVINGEFITVAQGNAGLKFTPDAGIQGSFDVQASLEDANSGLGGGIVTATIFVNSIPTVQNLPSFLSVDEDSPDINFDLFNYFDDAEDPDIDLLFTVTNTAPEIVNVQVKDNILAISFLENQNGTAFITIRCTDTQGAFVEAVIQLLVNPVNDAPVFETSPVLSVEQGELYEYEIVTSDVEGDARYFDWIAPAWLWLTDNGDGTAVLFGTPANEDVGEVDVKLISIESNSGLSTAQEFTINVINVNDTPTFVSTPPLEVFETEKYEYQIEIADPDPDDTYSVIIDLTTKPGWLVLSGGPNYVLEGFPPVGSAGNYTIKLIVHDAGGAASEQQFTITVSAPNNRPTITGNYNVTTDEDIPFTFVSAEFEARFQDPDTSDSLSFIVITELPANGTLTVSGVTVHTNDTIPVNSINMMVYTPGTDFYGSDYFEWKASDGKALSVNQGRVNISIIPQDDPPRIINIETSTIIYEFGDYNVTITETAEVREVDDGRIVSAKFSIISNYNNKQDSLSIDIFDGIATSWNDTTGVLSVTGLKNASVYQEIVRSLIYTNQNRFAPTTQTRTIQLTVFDGELESEPVTRNIQFEDTFVELFIPSAFTPNEDNANDTWEIDYIQEHNDAIVRVYSREGNKIYESIGQYKEWDGKYKGNYVKSGVYYYTIEIQKFERKYSGTITVLR